MQRTAENHAGFTWRKLLHFLHGSKRLLALGLFLGTLDAAAQASVPLFFRHVLNSLQLDAKGFMEGNLWPILGLGLALLIIFPVVAYFFHVLTTIAMMRLCRNLQVELYSHVQGLSVDFFQRYQVGEINSRLNSDMEVIAGSTGAVSMVSWAPSLLIYSLVMMFWISVPLALVCVALLVFIACFSILIMPRIKRWNRGVRDASGEVSASITEYIGIFGLLKAYSREDFAEQRVRSKSDHLLRRREEVTRWQHVFTDGMQTFTRFVGPMIILFVGAWWIYKGDLLAGDLAAFWGFWLQLAGVTQAIVFTFSGIMATMAALDRIFAFFDEKPIVKDPAHPHAIGHVKGEIELRDINFRYPLSGDKEGPVITNLNLRIAPGENVAVVGPSGAGKSTLLTLLLRFHDPDSGLVLLDGEDIRNVGQRELRSRIGIVLQESLFFAGTIQDNLRLARPDCTTDQIWEALEAANAAEFVREMPDGLETVLGERGAKLSGGQKQRLAIARVFLKDPAVVLFDEPTSALDAQSELHIKQAIQRLLHKRTAITVAHRLATIMDADRIIVMQKGRIIAHGTHEELRVSNPLYADLCKKQGLAPAEA